jgi:F-type H+-transporting ATPase subunit epsilon
MRVEVTTAERVVFSGEAEVLLAPGVEGQLGILPHHAPLMTILQPGELVLRSGDEESYCAVSGGFLEVAGNAVAVLADACERVEEIDEDRAQAAIKRAEERLRMRSADIDLERATTALRRAQVRLRVALRRRRRGLRSPGSESDSR